MTTARTTKAAADIAPEPVNETPNVATAIARVAADIGAIAKDQQVTGGGARFNFRGIDDVLNAIHQPLVDHGVSIIPVGFDVLDQTVGTTKNGTAQQHLMGLVHYRIVGPLGDWIEAAVVAEAQDTSDKAASKMMSMAYKYLAFQTFSIPVAGVMEESDRDAYDRAPQQPREVSSEEALARLDALCEQVGKTIDEVTAQFRERHGNITVEEFRALPVNELVPFVMQVNQYVQRTQQ